MQTLICGYWAPETEGQCKILSILHGHTHTGPHFQERLLCGGVKKTSCFFPKHKTLIRLVWFAGFNFIRGAFLTHLMVMVMFSRACSYHSWAQRDETTLYEEKTLISAEKKTLNGPPFRKQNRQFARAGYSCTTPVLTIDTSQTKVSRENWTRLDRNSCGG